jgi:hypothetical protein
MGGGTNGNANQGCAVAHQEGAFALEKGALGRKESIRIAKKTTLRAASAEPPVISKRKIRAIIRQKFDRPVKWDAPIGDYIKGGRPAVRAFFATLNRAFKAYGLNLKPGDLADVEFVEDLVTVVAGWFTRHGYQVTE